MTAPNPTRARNTPTAAATAGAATAVVPASAATPSRSRNRRASDSFRYLRGMERLLRAVQELSLARRLEDIQAIVRVAARELTGCDGATFVLRDNGQCHYADEDAIAPLWKGKRFPLEACISGWAMLNRKPAVIPDIYEDARIPHAAYRPTFVKSLVMVPIRTLDPIGAIGNYWAHPHEADPREVRLLQALADSTSIALENVQLYEELEQRVRDRTAELERVNAEVSKLSTTDELTGLLNRRGFYALAQPALSILQRSGGECLVLFVDVDGLKGVNDRLGHDTGDEMIAQMARVLSETLRDSDIVARLGGDEFCVISLGADVDGEALSARLCRQLEQANSAERPYTLSASIGYVRERVFAATTLDGLLARADSRMYEVKRARKLARQ